MTLGEKIFELRKKCGLSQEQLGEKINVTRQTISNWELGETSPNPEQLKLISKELNVSIDELLDNDIQSVLGDSLAAWSCRQPGERPAQSELRVNLVAKEAQELQSGESAGWHIGQGRSSP